MLFSTRICSSSARPCCGLTLRWISLQADGECAQCASSLSSVTSTLGRDRWKCSWWSATKVAYLAPPKGKGGVGPAARRPPRRAVYWWGGEPHGRFIGGGVRNATSSVRDVSVLVADVVVRVEVRDQGIE